VAEGQLVGPNSPDGQRVTVPAYIAYTPAQSCYAFNEHEAANCSKPLSGNLAAPTASATTAGLYNPMYYALVGWPALIFHDDRGIYAMRIVSGVFSSLFLAVSAMLIFSWRRSLIPMIGLATAATPMVFFLNGVVNPNSLETTATLATFTAVLTMVRERNRSMTTELSVITLISASIAVNTRGLSPLWVLIALLVPFILASGSQVRALARLWAVRGAVVIIGLSSSLAVLWTVKTNSLGGLTTVVTDLQREAGVGSTPLRGFAQIFAGTFDYGEGMIGVFGWQDTPAPSVVFFFFSLLIGCIFLVCFASTRGRALTFGAILTSVVVFLPPLLQAIYIHGGGNVWQGRYALPIFVCAVVGLAATVSDQVIPKRNAARRIVIFLAIGWTFTEAYSAFFALKRYSVGTSGESWGRVFAAPDWAPPGGTLLSGIVILSAAAATGMLLALLMSQELRSSPLQGYGSTSRECETRTAA